MEVLLDGESLSETQVYAQALAAEGIPALAVAGDSRMLETFGEGELGGARLVATKDGLGRAEARSEDPSAVRAKLATAISEALSGPLRPPPARAYPAELRITLEDRELARMNVAEPAELLPAVASIFRASRASREYRQLARLLPVSGVRRRLGSALATPVMLAKERRWLAAAP
jgi:D-aminopeptidase